MRELVTVGLDGRSQPMVRYREDMHLPDSQRRIVRHEDRVAAAYVHKADVARRSGDLTQAARYMRKARLAAGA